MRGFFFAQAYWPRFLGLLLGRFAPYPDQEVTCIGERLSLGRARGLRLRASGLVRQASVYLRCALARAASKEPASHQ